MKPGRRFTLTLLNRRKMMLMAAMACGTAFQLSTCRSDAALFGLRWAFSSVTLPINTFIRDLLLSFV